MSIRMRHLIKLHRVDIEPMQMLQTHIDTAIYKCMKNALKSLSTSIGDLKKRLNRPTTQHRDPIGIRYAESWK